MSHYDTLKVPKTASQDDIKKAYRRLASKHHPDKGGSKDEFQRIEEAYRVLSDPEQRQQYDLEQQGFGPGVRFRWNQNTDGMPDLDDIFAQFGFRANRGHDPHERMRQPRRNKDIKVEIPLSLEETLQSSAKVINIQTSNGRHETVNITIPRGVEDGSTIKYPGLGDNFFESLARGDMYVVIRVTPHPKFRVSNNDLICSIQISAYDAILGTETEIRSIDGKTFLLSVAPGTQSGTKLRIKDQGLYSAEHNARGNLLVEVTVSIPKETDPDRRSLLERLRSGQ
jgi:curved DNA-binding protein